MKRISELWQPVLGRIVWGVARGHGSFLTMEFGAPHLVVREPVTPRHATSPNARRNLLRRRAYVQGDWHFWVMYGEWRLRTRDGEIESNADAGSAGEVLRDLEGQKLLAIESGAKPNSCVLTFDLGAVLEIWPSSKLEDDQWSLHAWNGRIANLGHGGSLRYEDAKTREPS